MPDVATSHLRRAGHEVRAVQLVDQVAALLVAEGLAHRYVDAGAGGHHPHAGVLVGPPGTE